MENKEAIELLEKAITNRASTPNGLVILERKGFYQALALLKPCPTCGGSKQVGKEQFYYGRSVGWKECPDCAEKPESQEPKDMGHFNKEEILETWNNCEPESREPGLAESDYMSIEQREKFEAKNIPEKVETNKLPCPDPEGCKHFKAEQQLQAKLEALKE